MEKKDMERVCPDCGARIAAGVEGAPCPACLFRMAIEADTSVGTDHPDVPDWAPEARNPPTVPPGGVHRFGDYELLTRRGRGGMGVVYEARHVGPIRTERVVALKMILGGENASRAALALFHAEVRAVAKLEHPHISLWFVEDTDGVSKAVHPKAVTIGKSYAWRDYHKGAMKLAEKGLRSTYVSSAYKSETSGSPYAFTISAPIYGRGGRALGILGASVMAAATLGSLVVRDPQSLTVLAAPRGRDRDDPSPPSTHVILLHPAYAPGDAIPIDNEQVRMLDGASRDPAKRIEQPLGLPPPDLITSSDDYEDPLGKGNSDERKGTVKPPNDKYKGRYLAGFAPVGNTGFVVIVQTPEGVVLDSEWTLAKQFAKWTAIAAGSGVLLMVFGAWYGRRRRAERAR